MKFSTDVLKYEDIREQLITLLNEKSEFNGQFDFTSSNIGYFVDIMSYIATNLNYNISNIANNMFLDTTDIRKNAVSLAKSIGYTPKRSIPAQFSGKFYYKDVNLNVNDTIIIDTRSIFYGSYGNVYTNLESITLKYKGNPTQLEADYVLYQGKFMYFEVAPDGNENFTFMMNNKKIANPTNDFFNLYVVPTSENYKVDGVYNASVLQNYKWERLQTFKELIQDNKEMKIYHFYEDIIDEGSVKISFGNGIIGKIPSNDYTIVVEYFETEGSIANNELLISLPTLDMMDNIYLNYQFDIKLPNKFSINNFDNSLTRSRSYGGTDIESIKSIQISAPKFFNTTGVATTYNSYKYMLISNPKIKTTNVVGGMELFPNNYSQLGNIYISVVPNISFDNFLYNNEMYIDPITKYSIVNLLNQNSIISTKKFFYNPTYIVVDVTPHIEFGKTQTIAEQLYTKQIVVDKLKSYFKTDFSELGLIFRESKVEAVIDAIDTITSSNMELKFYFAINNNTVSDIITGINDMMFLPIRNVYDTNFNISSKLPFIKTLMQVIKDTKQSPSYWEVLDYEFNSLRKESTDNINQISYKQRLNELNGFIMNLPIDECSIYSETPLINNSINPINHRLYNKDIILTSLIHINYNSAGVYATPAQFITFDKRYILISIKKIENANDIYTVIYEDDNILYTICVLNASANTLTIVNPSIYINEDIESNLARIGIALSQYIYKYDDLTSTPFILTRNIDGSYELSVNIASTKSQIVIDSLNKIYELTINSENNISFNRYDDRWGDTISLTGNYAILDYTSSSTIPPAVSKVLLEFSHINYNTYFVGYIGVDTFIKLDKLYNTDGTYIGGKGVGSYYIIKDYLLYNGDIYLPNDVMYVNTELKLVKSTNKSNISSNSVTLLNTTKIQNTIYIYNSNMVLYSDNGIEDIYQLIPSNPNDITKVVQSTQELPKKLEIGTIVKVQNPTIASEVLFPNTLTTKISSLLRRNINDTAWESIIDDNTKLYNGDIIICDDVNTGTWYLLNNIDTGNAIVTFQRTISTSPTAVTDYFEVPYDGASIYQLRYIRNTAIPCTVSINGSVLTDGNDYTIEFNYDSTINSIVLVPEYASIVKTNWNVSVQYTTTTAVIPGTYYASDRIVHTIPQTPTLDVLENANIYKYQIYQISNDIYITSGYINSFVNTANNNILNVGDFIICVNAEQKKWKIFDNDYYEYTIDIINDNSKFPIDIIIGEQVKVYTPSDIPIGTMTNFQGYFPSSIANDSKVVFCADEKWISVPSNDSIQNLPVGNSNIGDLLYITDTGGNLNDSPLIHCPTFTTSHKVFNYNDILYYTGSYWVKIHPINIYNDTTPPNEQLYKTVFNNDNINSDIIIKYISSGVSEYKIEICYSDIYHNQVVADFEYESGELIFRPTINKQKNKNDIEYSAGKLSDIFDKNNYTLDTQQVDLIRILPTKSNGVDVTDFDTTFNQYIIGKINSVVSK